MSEISAQSIEQTAGFSAAICTDETIRKMTIPYWRSLGEEVENRYIPEGVCLPSSRYDYTPSMITALREFVSQDLTGDTLAQARVTYDKAQYQIGLTLEAAAVEHGLAEVMTPSAVLSRLPKEDYETEADLVSHARDGFTGIHPARSWEIITTEQQGPVLIWLHEADNKNEPAFGVVYLDQLYQNEATRAVLVQVIQDYHYARAQHAAADDIMYNQALHRIATDSILPDIFVQYSLVEGDKKGTEAASIENYLRWLAQTGGYTQECKKTRDKLRNRHVLLEDGKTVFVGNYLNHLENCPGEPEARRDEAAAQTALLKTILAAGTEAEPLNPELARFLPVLQEPYAAILDPATLSVVANKQALVNAAQAMHGLKTKEAALAALRRQAPGMHAAVRRFEPWLYSQTIKLDDIYAQGITAARGVARADAPQAIRDEIDREVRRIIDTSTSQEIKGTYTNPDTIATVNNPYLADALTVLAIQQATGKEAELLDEWIRTQRKDLEEYRTATTHLSEELQAKAGITRQDIEKLTHLVGFDDSESDKIFGRRKAFGILFNALLLHQQGAVNLSSPVFKSFLRELIGPVRPRSDSDTGEVTFIEVL